MKHLPHVAFRLVGTAVAMIAFVALVAGIVHSHPLLDDYSLLYAAHLGESFLGGQILFYMQVHGRILATLLSSLLMHESVIQVLYRPFLLVFAALFIAILYRSFRTIGRMGPAMALLSGLVFVFCTFLMTRQPSTMYFWLSGVIVYQAAFILTVCCWILLHQTSLSHDHLDGMSIGKRMSIIVLGVCAVQFFELSALSLAPLAAVGAIASFRKRSRMETAFWAVFLLSIAVSFALNVFAPGNAIRAVQYAGQRTTGDLTHSFLSTLSAMGSFALSARVVPVLLLLTMTFPLASGSALRKGITAIHPAFHIAFMFWILFSFHFIYLFKLGGIPPYRVINFMNALLLFHTVLLGVSISARCSWAGLRTGGIELLTSIVLLSMLAMPSMLRTIYGDLIHGRMSSYDAQMNSRNELIRQCPDEICFVPALTDPPTSIVYQELPTDSLHGNSFYNRQLAHYHGKQWVFAR